MGTSAVMDITAQMNHPGITRARSHSTALKASCATCHAGTLRISGAGRASPEFDRPATAENSVSTGPGHTAVTDTPAPRNSARKASEKLVT